MGSENNPKTDEAINKYCNAGTNGSLSPVDSRLTFTFAFAESCGESRGSTGLCEEPRGSAGLCEESSGQF